MSFGRFGDFGHGPSMEGEPWIVSYTAYFPDQSTSTGRIRVWTKRGKQGAIERVKYIEAQRHCHITIWNVYQPGRTPAGLYVPEGYEEVPE